MAAFTPSSEDYIPDGVYIGLPDTVYFAQDALGSTDLVRLHFRREGWWWQSRHNPDAVRKPNQALNYGTALHAILLEGIAAYEDRFAVIPEKPPGAVTTIKEMQAVLVKEGFSIKGTGNFTAEDWALAMRTSLPQVPCWPNILEDFAENLREDQKKVTAVEDRMLRFMVDVAMSPDRRDNVEIRNLFASGAGRPALAEVSILKTFPDGIRRRWRIDRMFPAFDVDLKSLGNWSGRPLPHEVGEVIARNGHDIQRADYFEGRLTAYDFIRDGFQVYGGSLEQRQWLGRFPDEFPDFDWAWIYYQKPDPKGLAPVIFPVMDVTFHEAENGSGDPVPSDLMIHGSHKKLEALNLYRRCVAEFGLDRPWARVDPLHYTDETREPRIFLPSYIANQRPTEEAAYPTPEEET